MIVAFFNSKYLLWNYSDILEDMQKSNFIFTRYNVGHFLDFIIYVGYDYR